MGISASVLAMLETDSELKGTMEHFCRQLTAQLRSL